MPKTKRSKPIYQRGSYQLVRRPDRTNLEIIWYDRTRRRERCVSAGTSDDDAGRKALDRLYLASAEGHHLCPTCGQATGGIESQLLSAAIADYLVEVEDRTSLAAIRARLNHVLDYIEATGAGVRCDHVDETWVARFRKWMLNRPIVGEKGKSRDRSLSTVENSVLQLAAAIRASWRRGDTRRQPQFRPVPTTRVNRTPEYRASVADLARMMAYAIEPAKKRERLANFLRASIATWARPDAVLDISVDPARRQWNSAAQILNLNPFGRPQTKKYRTTVPVPHQFAEHLNAATGFLIPVKSIRSAWDTMCIDLALPGNGESGSKLIRRSMADIARQRLPVDAWVEVEMMLGHDRFDEVSGLYAPFRPDYLRRALAVTVTVIDEIEELVPGAFYRSFTAAGDNVTSIRRKKNG